MATTAKKNDQQAQVEEIPSNGIIYNTLWKFPKGDLRMTLNLHNILDRLERYKDQLVYSRDLPFNPATIDIGDPVVQWISEKMPWIASDKVKATAITHYQKLHSSTEIDAFILAASVDNQLTNPPTAYVDEPENEDIPGIVTMPTYKKNLEHPVEARLKQIMDIMESDVQTSMRLIGTLETAMIRIKQMGAKTDEDGFPG